MMRRPMFQPLQSASSGLTKNKLRRISRQM
jgi:hypothetical protein